jgi:cytochrome oxidase assembly protein ShyY1
MYRFLLRPRWLAFHALCLAAMVAMVNLGLWQLRRLDERTAFNARVTANGEAPPAPLGELLALPTLDADYRRTVVEGVYDEHTFTVVNVSQQGSTGVSPIAALQLDDGTLLIVNRGFVATGTDFPAPPRGQVQVAGRLRRSQTPRAGQPADNGSERLTEIRRVDLGALAQQFDQPLAPMYLDLLESDPAEPDVIEPTPFPTLDSGPHLSYALQWFVFTVCVGVGWVLAVRRSIGERSEPSTRPRRGPPPLLTGDEVVLTPAPEQPGGTVS